MDENNSCYASKLAEAQSGDEDLNVDIESPTEFTNTTCNIKSYSHSRTSSVGSNIPSSSSAQNSDDEDSDQKPCMSFKERRREAHTHAEQKRRDAIKKGYADLQLLVPTCQQPENSIGWKLSKVTVLQRSVHYMNLMVQQKQKQEDELTSLRRELVALKIMKTNYEKIVSMQQNSTNDNHKSVSDKLKFEVFQTIMDSLFHSFNTSISVTSFTELSRCVLNWIEEHCKPQILRQLTLSILRCLNPQLT